MKCKSGIEIQSKIMILILILILEQDFDFDKNFAESHLIWWVSLEHKA